MDEKLIFYKELFIRLIETQLMLQDCIKKLKNFIGNSFDFNEKSFKQSFHLFNAYNSATCNYLLVSLLQSWKDF